MPTPGTGLVVVAGAGVVVGVTFSTGPSPPSYSVDFQECGLPSGTNWSVSLNGVTNYSLGSEIIFLLRNGSYYFDLNAVTGYSPSPASGFVTVQGQPVTLAVTFTANPPPSPSPYHSISFHETGPPNGTGWGVVIGSSIETSLGNTITFSNEFNGSYGHVVLAISGYTATYSGTVTIAGSNVTVDVAFSPLTYPVIIIEFGLANGTNWSVTVSNNSTGFHETRFSTSNAIQFELPNGTYSISVMLPAGYSFTLSSSAITVDGKSPTSPSVDVTSSGHSRPWLSSSELGVLVAAAVATGILVASVLLVKRPRRRPPAPPSG